MTNQNATLLIKIIQRETNQNALKKIKRQKYANNDAEYDEPLVTHEVLSYFNIF